MQTKLAAARNTAASLESAAKAPGSAIKVGGANRAHAAEATQATQIAQLKEELYSDLSGLIIRDVKTRETDNLYDCIQTGVNGSELFLSAFLFPLGPNSWQLFISNWPSPRSLRPSTRAQSSSTFHCWMPIVIATWSTSCLTS